MNKRYIIAGLSILFAWGTAQAAVVGIDLSGNAARGPIADSLPGVAGKASDVAWTRVNNKNLYSNLIDEDGVLTGASFKITGAGTVYFASTDAVAGNDFFETYANLGGSGTPGPAFTNSFTISGITNAADLYFYATWQWADAGSEFRVSSDGGTNWSEWKLADGVPSVENAEFIEGQSYVVFSNITAHTDGTILGEWTSTTNGNSLANRAIFNAVQIVGDFDEPAPPVFTTNEFTEVSATAGFAYSGSIAGTASGVDITYSNATASTWLDIAEDGSLSGTPQASDIGMNSFSVIVTDYIDRTATATMYIEVVEPETRYTDTFDGDGIDVNTGEGGGLVFQKWDANFLSVTDTNTALEFTNGGSGNAGAQRSAVYTENIFSVANGFSLEVVYNIEAIPGTLSETAAFGLVDSTANLDGAFTFPKTYNSLGISLTTRNSQGLNQTDVSGVLTNLSNAQTISSGTSITATLTVDAEGNYSYSIDGQAASTGTTTFDLTKGYYFAIFSQRPTTVFSVESVSFIPNGTITEIGAIDMELSGGTTAGFTWFGEYGGNYELQVRDNLTIGGEEAWTYVTNVIGNDAEITVTDEMDEIQGFYRIKLVD